MGKSSRYRYVSRREKWNRTRRNVNLVLIFGSIWAVLWMIMKRHEIIGWLKTYTYLSGTPLPELSRIPSFAATPVGPSRQ